jgi:hypothetical protein
MNNLNLYWFEGELTVLNKNRAVDILIRKANRADRFWNTLDRWIGRLLWTRR